MDDTARAAFDRLLDLARSDTGQARRAANFIRASWNADSLGGFDICRPLRPGSGHRRRHGNVFAWIAHRSNAVYPDEYRGAIKGIIEAWRPEVWARSRGPPRLIAPHPFSPQQFEKEADGFALIVERVLHRSARRPDATPPSHKPRLPEQRFLDRQRIEPRHVAARVAAFDIELIGLRDHGEQNRASRLPRPMIGLNHWIRIDSFS
jgi:hypothetical protein